MRVKFKQAVHIGGKDYPRGVHEVSEAHLKDKYFHKLIQANLVEDAEATKVVSADSLQDRQRKLAERILPAAKAANVSPLILQETAPRVLQETVTMAVEELLEATEEGEAAEESEETVSESFKKQKHKNKKR